MFLVTYVLHRWYTFNWKAFLLKVILMDLQVSVSVIVLIEMSEDRSVFLKSDVTITLINTIYILYKI